MKRYKQKENGMWVIDCICGIRFDASTISGLLASVDEDKVLQFRCFDCGQQYNEPIRKPINLETPYEKVKVDNVDKLIVTPDL